MKREPTAEEREKIGRAIAAGDRIEATSIYISITECGLTEAQEFIKALTNALVKRIDLLTIRGKLLLGTSICICSKQRHNG